MDKINISIIVAFDKNFLIGNDDKIPWFLPADLSYFKKKTLNKPVIMGKKTFNSIVKILKKPLPKRFNIVLSRKNGVEKDNLIFATSFFQAVLEAQKFLKKNKNDEKEIFIIGGASVYKQAMELGLVDRIYATYIDGEFDGNIFFPKEFLNDFKKVEKIFRPKDEKNKYDMNFVILEKKNISL